ncbi:MAG: ABC transporter permease, partial [Candidatus Aminicenantaceae bacterium]
MFKNYIKIAFRNIRRYKGYSLINIAGLTVGMACFILIFLWVYDELNYDTYHTHSDRLCRIILRKAGDPGIPSAPYILPQILKDEYPEIVEVTRVRTRGYPSAIRHGDITFYEQRFFLTDPSFFSMFSYDFAAGNPKTVLTNPNSVVITEEAAHKYFGDENPTGKVLRWNNTRDLEVTGIIKKVPYNSHLQFDFMASLQLYDNERLSSWWREAAAYVLLQEGVSVKDVSQKIAGTIQRYHPEDDYVISLQPVKEAHLNIAQGGRSDKRFVLLFALIAVMILAIACVNFMNITTARSGIRALEVGMRKVVGAKRADIIKQFLGESVFLSLISFFLAITLVDIILPTFNRLQGSLAYIEKVFNETSPAFPFEYHFLDEWFEMIYLPLKIMNHIFNSFAFLAVFISCLGLFGLASLLMEQRKKEIGIRKVLGASTAGVMFLLSKRFMRIILVANMIAVPVAYFATRMFLNLFVYRTKLDAGVVVATVTFTFVAALLTISYQVIKTALA